MHNERMGYIKPYLWALTRDVTYDMLTNLLKTSFVLGWCYVLKCNSSINFTNISVLEYECKSKLISSNLISLILKERMIVIQTVYSPDLSGYKLLEHVHTKMHNTIKMNVLERKWYRYENMRWIHFSWDVLRRLNCSRATKT